MSPFPSSLFCLIPLFSCRNIESPCQICSPQPIFLHFDTSPPLFSSFCFLLALHLSFLNHHPSLKSLYFFHSVRAVRLPGVLVCCLSSTARLNSPQKGDFLLLYQLPHTVRCPRLGGETRFRTDYVFHIQKG